MQKVSTLARQTENMMYLSSYATYLINSHLADFQQRCYKHFIELEVPILKHLDKKEGRILADRSTLDLLTALAQQTVSAHIHTSVSALLANQVPDAVRTNLVVDDITLIAHARKCAFLDFIPSFSSDPSCIIKLVGEIDAYILEYTTCALKAVVELTDQKMSDQLRRLEESERRSKQAEAITHIGTYTWDLVEGTLAWSDELYRIYGLDPLTDSIPYDKIVLYNHPDDREKVSDCIQKARENCEPFNFLYRIVLPDGLIKALHAQGEVMAGPDGEARLVFGTAQDVTERQKLLNQLQKNEQLYRQVETIAHVGCWYWDVEDNVVTWTDELYRIYGIEPQSEKVTFESFLELVHPDDRELVAHTVGQALTTGQPYMFYHRIRTRDGKTKILHAQGEVLKDHHGKVVQMMGSGQDVTIQKKAEARLLENQNFIKKIADAIPAIISTYYVDTGKYTFINQGVMKLLNYDPTLALEQGVPFFVERVHPEDLAGLTAKNAQILAAANQLDADREEDTFDYQYRLRHQDGNYRWMHTFGTVFERSKTRQVKQILNISLDITERVEAEQVLLQRTRELQQSNASLEEFAYITSHDLKEPLRKISLFVERLASLHTTCTQEEKLYYDRILNASARMRQMIDDILSLSLISNKRKSENTDLQKIMQGVLAIFDNQITTAGALIESDDLPTIRAIPAQIDQLFQNLISNSLKFVRANVSPHITIRYRYLSPSEVTGNVATANRYIKLTFSDNGIGFDNNFQDKIFAIFQRLHHKHQYEGTGIGLAICKKIVTNHGGSIEATGTVNEGAVFSVILPV